MAGLARLVDVVRSEMTTERLGAVAREAASRGVTVLAAMPAGVVGSTWTRPVLSAERAEVSDPCSGATSDGRWVVRFGDGGCLAVYGTRVDAVWTVTVPGPEARRQAEDALCREAEESGYDAGWSHANYLANVDPSDREWDVPVRFAGVAESYYRAGFASGVTDYREQDTDAA